MKYIVHMGSLCMYFNVVYLFCWQIEGHHD